MFRAVVAAVALAVLAGGPASAETQQGKFFVWVELIGFDNALGDYGVGEYLSRMPRRPDMISILLDNDLLLTSYEGYDAAAKLLPDNCAYGARPYNAERRRQEWTQGQLKGLVAELRKRGIDVFASFFHWYPDVMPKPDAEAERFAGLFVRFLTDFGFTGLHGSDGYAPPRYLLPECTDAERPAVARRQAARFAANWKTFASALKAEGLKTWINTCWTLDPFEALYRYGVDYRLLAQTGVDGFVVESSAAALQVLGGGRHLDSPTIYKSMAMLMRLKAAAPEMPLVLLHGIHDGNEQWSALRHAPSHTRSEALQLGTLFYNNRRILDGFLACLGDTIKATEWKELDRVWKLPFLDVKEPFGLRVVWSDRAFDREFDDCVVSHDASSFTLLRKLLAHGMSSCCILSSDEALKDKSLPLILLNPEFYPEEELAALRKRPARVFEIGRGARSRCPVTYVPRKDTATFPGMPTNDSCYFTRPLSENLPPDEFFRHEAEAATEVMPFCCFDPKMYCWGFRLANGRLAVLVRNDGEIYGEATVRMQNCVSDVRVHSDFPTAPVKTRLAGRIAPHDTMFISVGEHAWPLPDPNVKCTDMR